MNVCASSLARQIQMIHIRAWRSADVAQVPMSDRPRAKIIYSPARLGSSEAEIPSSVVIF